MLNDLREREELFRWGRYKKEQAVQQLYILYFVIFFLPFSLRAQSVYSECVSLLFCGDVNFTSNFEKRIGDSLETYGQSIQWLSDADITMVNLENTVTQRGTPAEKEYNFRAHPKYTSLLQFAGIDLVTIGNNHIYDYGREGVFDTIEQLDSLGVAHVGAGMNMDSARIPVVLEVKGLKIGFLGYLDSIGTVNLQFAGDTIAGAANFDIRQVRQDVKSLRERVDVVVVNVHWGAEGSHQTKQRQIDLAHLLIDAGADIIVGHHPHLLQGIEVYNGGIIAYSLGNFIFGGHSRHTYSTAILEIKIPVDCPARLEAEIVPVIVKKYVPSIAKGKTANQVLKMMKMCSEYFAETIFKRD